VPSPVVSTDNKGTRLMNPTPSTMLAESKQNKTVHGLAPSILKYILNKVRKVSPLSRQHPVIAWPPAGLGLTRRPGPVPPIFSYRRCQVSSAHAPAGRDRYPRCSLVSIPRPPAVARKFLQKPQLCPYFWISSPSSAGVALGTPPSRQRGRGVVVHALFCSGGSPKGPEAPASARAPTGRGWTCDCSAMRTGCVKETDISSMKCTVR